MKYIPDTGGGYDYTDNWRKPSTLYALASGIYPIIDRVKVGSGIRGPGIQYNYSKHHVQPVSAAPISWYESGKPIRPLIMGNYIFQSYKANPRNFAMPSPFLDKYKDRIIGDISSRAKGATEQMNRDVATAMNEKVKKSYNIRGNQSYIESMEEASDKGRFTRGAGEASRVYGGGVGRPAQYDFLDEETGRGVNVTKSKLTSPGHGMYGKGLAWVRERWAAIDAQLKNAKLTEREAYQQKIDAGVNYFKQRLPEWNSHIRQAKSDLGWDTSRGGAQHRQSQGRARQLRTQLSNTARNPSAGQFQRQMYEGMRNQFFVSTAFMNKAGAQMTKQLFANRDLFFTQQGAFENYQIGPMVQGQIGAFKGWASGPRVFEYKDIHKLEGTVHYGYARTVDHGMTYGEQAAIESGLSTDMASFLQSEHGGTRMTLDNNSLRSISSSNIGAKAREIRPTVNLVQAGKVFNMKINELIKDVSWDGSEDKGRPPSIVRQVINRNRFRLSYSSKSPVTVWAAPYLSVFSSKALMTG